MGFRLWEIVLIAILGIIVATPVIAVTVVIVIMKGRVRRSQHAPVFTRLPRRPSRGA